MFIWSACDIYSIARGVSASRCYTGVLSAGSSCTLAAFKLEHLQGPPIHDIQPFDAATSPAFEPESFKCDMCAAELPMDAQGCSKCHIAKYCGRECQAAAWARHKHVCALQRDKGGAHSAALELRLTLRLL